MLSALIPSFSVRPAREHVDHGEEVCCKLRFAAARSVDNLVLKDETCPGSTDDPFDELAAEPGEPVWVGHHNFSDQPFLDMLQKPREAFAFVVEAGGDVCVDAISGELFLHRLDLAFEVVFLLGRGHSTVDGSSRTRLGGAAERRRVVFGLACGADRSNIPSSLSTGRKDEVDETSTSPVAKCVACNTEGAGRFGRAKDSMSWRRGSPPLATFLGRHDEDCFL